MDKMDKMDKIHQQYLRTRATMRQPMPESQLAEHIIPYGQNDPGLLVLEDVGWHNVNGYDHKIYGRVSRHRRSEEMYWVYFFENQKPHIICSMYVAESMMKDIGDVALGYVLERLGRKIANTIERERENPTEHYDLKSQLEASE